MLPSPREAPTQAQAVPLAAVMDWYRRGWRGFSSQPGPWVVLVLLYAVIHLGAQLLPPLGPALLTVLAPGFGAGLLQAARDSEAGWAVDLRHLFAGLTDPGSRRGLLILGAALLAWILLLGASYLTAVEGLQPAAAAGMASAEADPVAALAGLAFLIAALSPAMALFFAVPVVHFAGSPALPALGASLTACLRNLAPLLVYAVTYSLLAFLASLPYGLGMLVLGPVGVGSNLACYTDIFPGAAEPTREDTG